MYIKLTDMCISIPVHGQIKGKTGVYYCYSPVDFSMHTTHKAVYLAPATHAYQSFISTLWLPLL